MLTTAPVGHEAVPPFDDGWVVGTGMREPFLMYANPASANWSDDLERLHAESSRDHFLDVWTRSAIVDRMRDVPQNAIIADIGCSSGYLLGDIKSIHPDAILIGVDLVESGLRRAHALLPTARLLQADACDLPLQNGTLDAVVSANLLEHIADDRRAVGEIARVLRPGGRAVIVVPAGRSTYDYYDRFLGHERRYDRGELAGKARAVRLDVVEDRYIASLLYPAFWLVKKRNRRRFRSLAGAALEKRVARDIVHTGRSRTGIALGRLEQRLQLRLPFGIRNLVVLEKGSP